MSGLTNKCSNSILFLIMLLVLDVHHQLARPPPAAKKRKGDAVTPSGADPSSASAPSSVGRGGDGVCTSPARSSSRGRAR